ncbi:MAG: prolyl oligopeptidase family serine peptidase [Candidatus Hydrogenedentota bacterium]
MRILLTTTLAIMIGGTVLADELNLPDPLVANDGTAITTLDQWKDGRREEVLELFREHVYGRRPQGMGTASETQNFVRPWVKNHRRYIVDVDNVDHGRARAEYVQIKYDAPRGSGELNMTVVYPSDVTEPYSLPAFLLICNRDPSNIDLTENNGFWPWREIVRRGFVAAAFWNGEVDPDNDDGFRNGVHGLFDPKNEPRPGDAWGTISAWGWGASLCMDYLAGNKWIDQTRVALVGHSRGGKTALWAGAEDRRFGMIVSNESGCTGAAIARRMKGETIEKINNGFPHWFNGNYKKYNGRDTELPVDQHMLAALIAPRLLYIASAQEDSWADPEGEFLSAYHARPVYQLYGHDGLGDVSFPAVDKPVHGDRVGYHIRSGKHNLTKYDWRQYMRFADKHWK